MRRIGASNRIVDKVSFVQLSTKRTSSFLMGMVLFIVFVCEYPVNVCMHEKQDKWQPIISTSSRVMILILMHKISLVHLILPTNLPLR